MAVMTKRSEKHLGVSPECPWGCCGGVRDDYPKHSDRVKLRRKIRRTEKQAFGRELRRDGE